MLDTINLFNNSINYIIIIIIYFWIFWGAYVLVMGIYRAFLNKKLTIFTMLLSAPFVAIGAVLDVFSNIFVATILFLEIPKELLVTTRLSRHNKHSSNWRKHLADYICTNLLDVFDPTEDHC